MTEVNNHKGTSAKIIADSISPDGVRLTTMECTFHRFILAELNTHRAFSRNSASSRAIPIEKQIERVKENPAMPIYWGANQKGMQAHNELSGEDIGYSKQCWDEANYQARLQAIRLDGTGLHKQLVNRLLEPFMWHTAIITATDWDNFFHQRCHPDAQPEMKALADAMQIAYFSHEPRLVNYGDWHLPYTSDLEWDELFQLGYNRETIEPLKRVSVARCARVSYLTQDGKRDIEEDLKLFERLTQGQHWSPFEHQATPATLDNILPKESIIGRRLMEKHPQLSEAIASERFGNFRGWVQFRKFFPNENRTRFIPNLPELAHIRMKMEGELGPARNIMEDVLDAVDSDHEKMFENQSGPTKRDKVTDPGEYDPAEGKQY